MRTAKDLLKRKKNMKKWPLARPGGNKRDEREGNNNAFKGPFARVESEYRSRKESGRFAGVVGGQGNW